MEEKGFIIVVRRVSRKYYEEKFYGMVLEAVTHFFNPLLISCCY